MKTGVIIQARMGSTRLPGKIMETIEGKTVLEHVIERVKLALSVDTIVIATSTLQNDDIIASEATRCGVNYFRGSEGDVLSRYYHAAKKHHLDTIVRITSDCPLIDPLLLDKMINCFIENNYDVVMNTSERTYPRGLDIEVFSLGVLEKAFNESTENYQREHVTPYIYENSKKAFCFKNDTDYSQHRWTLDTADDLSLIKQIYKNLYKGKHDFFMQDIIDLFEKKPELFNINAHIEQKKLK